MNHLTEYEQRTFNEKFNGSDKCAVLYQAADGQIAYNSDCTYKPHEALLRYIRNNEVFAFNPVHNDKTNLIWFDIDDHGNNPDAKEQADCMYKTLVELGMMPEYANSSANSYHICLWSKIPQSISYCQIVQRRLLEHLGIKCEYGPMSGKKIRPYWMGNHLKPKGCLIKEGHQHQDFRLLRKFYKPDSFQRIQKPKIYREFDVKDYIPTGGNRHNLMLALCRDMGNLGYKPEDILKASLQMYDLGVVHDSREKHEKDTLTAIQGFKPMTDFKQRKDWSAFWKQVPPGMSFDELLEEMSKYAEPLRAFPCTVREMSMYFKGKRGFSKTNICRKLALSVKVELVKRGYSYYGEGDASMYRLREPAVDRGITEKRQGTKSHL